MIIFMKIVMLEAKTVSCGDVSFDEIYRLGEVTEYPLTPDDKIVERIGDAEAVLCNKTPFTESVLRACPKLKYIGVCATGYNNIDIKTAAELGITVCNVPSYSTEAVAQQVFSYILHFANKTADYNNFVHDGGWINSDTFSCFKYPIIELADLTIGIIGYGSIGKAVAKIAKAFNMNVIVNTRTAKQDGSVKFAELNYLLKSSDIVTVHCPLTDTTKGLINLERLKLCKPSAIFINTSRGAVVNENDLAYSLNNGIIAGAGLDVLAEEPMRADCPLFTAKNCVITPHIAWAPLKTRERLIRIVAENLQAFIDGKPVNTVE
jgi:glycerate dehydrogenase